jgi:hypothetical protein
MATEKLKKLRDPKMKPGPIHILKTIEKEEP